MSPSGISASLGAGVDDADGSRVLDLFCSIEPAVEVPTSSRLADNSLAARDKDCGLRSRGGIGGRASSIWTSLAFVERIANEKKLQPRHELPHFLFSPFGPRFTPAECSLSVPPILYAYWMHQERSCQLP